jgi:hypothetical protein
LLARTRPGTTQVNFSSVSPDRSTRIVMKTGNQSGAFCQLFHEHLLVPSVNVVSLALIDNTIILRKGLCKPKGRKSQGFKLKTRNDLKAWTRRPVHFLMLFKHQRMVLRTARSQRGQSC